MCAETIAQRRVKQVSGRVVAADGGAARGINVRDDRPADGNLARVHAKLEYRRGKFVITDLSTNGTYVGQEGGAEVFLRRESMPLVGHGTISLGSPAKQEPAAVIRYAVS